MYNKVKVLCDSRNKTLLKKRLVSRNFTDQNSPQKLPNDHLADEVSNDGVQLLDGKMLFVQHILAV